MVIQASGLVDKISCRDVYGHRDLPDECKPTIMESPIVLGVDNAPGNSALVTCVLQAKGFRTLTASSGPAALHASRTQQPRPIPPAAPMPGEVSFYRPAGSTATVEGDFLLAAAEVGQ